MALRQTQELVLRTNVTGVLLPLKGSGTPIFRVVDLLEVLPVLTNNYRGPSEEQDIPSVHVTNTSSIGEQLWL